MSAPAIETENLTKQYPHGFLNLKKRTSLEGLNMQVERGEVFGFIGPNGAGKSTTIKLLMRLIFPTAGSARILHKPQLVILDEPMSGLDPVGRREVRDIILELKREGKTVMFSTHILSDAEMLCDRVGVIVGGKLRGMGAPEQLVDVKTQGMEILFELAGQSAVPLLAKATRTGDRYRLQVPEAELYGAIEQLRAAGAKILSVTQVKATLEEFFMNLVEADRAQAAAVEVSGK